MVQKQEQRRSKTSFCWSITISVIVALLLLIPASSVEPSLRRAFLTFEHDGAPSRKPPVTPCNYPAPETAQFTQCTAYMGVSYVCDADALLSRTEADQLDKLIAQNYTNCFCAMEGDGQSDRPACRHSPFGRLNIGIAIALNATAEQWRLESLACFDDAFKGKSLDEFSNSIGYYYAETIRRRWSTDDCETDVLVLFVHNFVFDDGATLTVQGSTKRSFVAFSARALQVFNAMRRWDIVRLAEVSMPLVDAIVASTEVTQLPTTTSSATGNGVVKVSAWTELKPIVKLLTSPPGPRTVAAPPWWALVVIGACCALTLALVAIGHHVDKHPSRPLKGPGSTTAIPRKWQAGFAGGLWDAS